MRRLTTLSAVAAAAVLTLSACGGGSDSGSDDAASEDICDTADGDGPTVGLAYDVGGRGDQSFNDSAYAGVEKAVEDFDATCVEGEAADQEPESAREDRLRNFAESGATVVIGVGFAYSESVNNVAPDFPDVNFLVVDGFDPDDTPNENVAYPAFAAEQASYLVGVAAAETSETGTVGFVGGVNNPLIQTFEAGYVAGAEAADPEVEVEVTYIQESDLSGFDDTAGGRAAATGQFDQGADVVYHASGKSGAGVFDAAVAAGEGNWAIGVDSDQYLSATPEQQERILTSALKRVDTGTYEFIASVDAGSPQTGFVPYDLGNDGVGYSTAGDYLGDISTDLEDYKAQIVSGEITVPTTP